MKFEEAMKLLRKGSKVRRTKWEPHCNICLNKDKVLNEDGSIFFMNRFDIVADDWECFEELGLDRIEQRVQDLEEDINILFCVLKESQDLLEKLTLKINNLEEVIGDLLQNDLDSNIY